MAFASTPTVPLRRTSPAFDNASQDMSRSKIGNAGSTIVGSEDPCMRLACRQAKASGSRVELKPGLFGGKGGDRPQQDQGKPEASLHDSPPRSSGNDSRRVASTRLREFFPGYFVSRLRGPTSHPGSGERLPTPVMAEFPGGHFNTLLSISRPGVLSAAAPAISPNSNAVAKKKVRERNQRRFRACCGGVKLIEASPRRCEHHLADSFRSRKADELRLFAVTRRSWQFLPRRRAASSKPAAIQRRRSSCRRFGPEMCHPRGGKGYFDGSRSDGKLCRIVPAREVAR